MSYKVWVFDSGVRMRGTRMTTGVSVQVSLRLGFIAGILCVFNIKLYVKLFPLFN